MKSAIFTFGRFNPPTIGHMLLIGSMKRAASTKGSDVFIFTGTSNDKTRNPLKYKNKISIMNRVFKDVTVVNDNKIKTIFKALDYLDEEEYNDVTMVVGSDRVSEFRKLLSRYKDNYKFKSINVISAGDRDPDADDVSGMSASKMRAAAKDGDYNAFKLGVPATMSDAETLKTFKLVQKGMGVKHFIKESWFNFEEFEMFAEKVVSLQTRRKMRQSAKRTAKRRAKIRKRKEKFMKGKKQLQAKAEKQAKMKLRKKMLGDVDWSSLSMQAKMQLDKRLEKKAGAIKKIARKLYPKVKQAEKERIQTLRQKTPGQPSNPKEVKEVIELDETGPQLGTYRGREVAKIQAKHEKEKSKLDAKIAEIKKKMDATPLGRLKDLESKMAAVQKKKKDANEKVEQAKERLRKAKERLAKLRGSAKHQTEVKEDTFKKVAIRKAQAEFEKEKAQLNIKLSDVKAKLDTIDKRDAGEARIKTLQKEIEAVRKRKKDAVEKIKKSKERIAMLKKSMQREDYASLEDRRAYLKKTVKQRTARTLARRKLEKEGKVKKGDGKDVDHKNGNPEDNSSGNLRVLSRSENRGRDNNKWRKKTNEEHGAGEEGTDKLLKKYEKDTPHKCIDKKFREKVKKVNGK